MPEVSGIEKVVATVVYFSSLRPRWLTCDNKRKENILSVSVKSPLEFCKVVHGLKKTPRKPQRPLHSLKSIPRASVLRVLHTGQDEFEMTID